MSVSDRNTDWRKKLREEIKGKARTEIERVKMPERAASERVKPAFGSKYRFNRRNGPPGSFPLYGLCQSDLYGRLPRRN